MKNLFKISALVLAFGAITYSASAQTKTSSSTDNGVRFSVGVDAGIPTGNLNNLYNWNIGGSAQVDIPLVSQLDLTVNAGYNSIQGKTIAGLTATNIQLLPVKAGLKFFPVTHFYIQGEAGAAFSLNKKDVGFTNSAAFVYAPQVGYQFALGGSNVLDAGVRYEASTKFNDNFSNSTVNFFALRVAYGF